MAILLSGTPRICAGCRRVRRDRESHTRHADHVARTCKTGPTHAYTASKQQLLLRVVHRNHLIGLLRAGEAVPIEGLRPPPSPPRAEAASAMRATHLRRRCDARGDGADHAHGVAQGDARASDQDPVQGEARDEHDADANQKRRDLPARVSAQREARVSVRGPGVSEGGRERAGMRMRRDWPSTAMRVLRVGL